MPFFVDGGAAEVPPPNLVLLLRRSVPRCASASWASPRALAYAIGMTASPEAPSQRVQTAAPQPSPTLGSRPSIASASAVLTCCGGSWPGASSLVMQYHLWQPWQAEIAAEDGAGCRSTHGAAAALLPRGHAELAPSLPWIGGAPPCYLPSWQVAQHREGHSYVLSPRSVASMPGMMRPRGTGPRSVRRAGARRPLGCGLPTA
jgi:hypothetical protein